MVATPVLVFHETACKKKNVIQKVYRQKFKKARTAFEMTALNAFDCQRRAGQVGRVDGIEMQRLVHFVA